LTESRVRSYRFKGEDVVSATDFPGITCGFEVGVYRPPSEGGACSLLVRVTRNCPWNKCTFCSMYKTEKFQPRSVEEVTGDIDAIARICETINSVSWQLGHGGQLNREVIVEVLRRQPQLQFLVGFDMVLNWLVAGGRTAFLQDADSIALRSEKLAEILRHLRKTFPSIERVTTYARAKTLFKKSLDELVQIREAGLDRVHVGLETGDDELLEKVQKGVTAAQHVTAGHRAMEAGFQLSEYWMPGLGGAERTREHALNTARVLSEIDPHYARSRPFFPAPGSPIAEEVERGELHLLGVDEYLLEIRNLVEALDMTGRVCFDHAGNLWRDGLGGQLLSLDYEGYKMPEQKDTLLERIDHGLEALESPPS
jgi:radical SAM superfamily enzyme YgiQ (UPF0313 family)